MYYRPGSLREAVQVLSDSDAQILAGGTDFFPALGDRMVRGNVVDLSGVGEIKGVTSDVGFFRIGGLTTWSEVVNADLPKYFDGLKAAAREIGGIQIQNRGTVAGNLCNASPAADSVPPLLTLDAIVELTSLAGTRRVRLGDFLVGNRRTLREPGEILTQVLIPRIPGDAWSGFLKLGARQYLVISIAMVAVVLRVDGAGCVAEARVCVGACSVVAKRLPELEVALRGASLLEVGALVEAQHLKGLSPIGDVRAGEGYRRDAALILVRRALDGCARGAV